jgi:hypothetical protein
MRLLALVLPLVFSAPLGLFAAPLSGIIYNEDDTHRFLLSAAGEAKPGQLDHLVDQLAGTHVSVLSICCCAKKTNFDSKAWEPYWEGFDPAADNSQPIFGEVPEADRPTYRTWLHNMLLFHQAGIDPNQRMVERCRKDGISPWISIRMNDVHDAHLAHSPLHSRFWMEHHEYWRYPDRFNGWNDRCFDYGLAPVRDHTMGLIKEVCDRYDMDGLELDWNRFPLHFREGEEQEKGKILTEWMAEVREIVRKAEVKKGHRILLVARVPAQPEVSAGTGLDAVTWAKRGIIDHLIVAPFWATTDFDIPVERWNELLLGTGVGVTAGIEALVRPSRGAQPIDNTVEMRRGAALASLARGSQGIYLFNYFEVPKVTPELLRELDSPEALAGKDRTYVVTYVDITIPGKPIPAPLPKSLEPGQSAKFPCFLGPETGQTDGRVQLGLSGANPQVSVRLNGKECNQQAEGASFTFRSERLQPGYNEVSVTNQTNAPLSIELVEVHLKGEAAAPSSH